MTTFRDITSESEIEAIAGRTGWLTPGTRDAAGAEYGVRPLLELG